MPAYPGEVDVRGCAVRLLGQALGWLLLVAAVLAGFQVVHGISPWAALGAGLMAGTAAWMAANCWLSAGQALLRRMRLAAASAGARPTDGRQALLVGRLRPLGEPLRAPFDGEPCVCYGYEIFELRGSGKRAHRARYYEGLALAPSVLETRTGTYKLLAVPELDGEPGTLSGESTVRRAASYLAATRFAPRGASLRELEARWNDADGAFRSDVAYVENEAVDLARCTLSQWRVAPGAEVCLSGLYSEARGGLVANPDWGQPTQLLQGDPRVVAGRLRSRAIVLTVVGALLAAAAVGLVAAFQSQAAGLAG